MPEQESLFEAPLSVTRREAPRGFPPGWVHHQVTMPRRAGVDAVAGAVQIIDPAASPDSDVPVAAAVRHWCGEDVGQLEVRSASAQELSASDAPVLRLSELELHDPALLETPGCPLVAVDDTTTLLWTRAVRHRLDSEPVAGWVPYGQVVVRWLERDPSQPVAHTMNMTGLGAATTRKAAIEHACAELAAQDAAMTWWMRGVEQRLPHLAHPEQVAVAWDHSRLERRLLTLPRTAGVQVVLAVVLDPELDVATMSPAAGPDAVCRAISHALWQHAVAHELLDAFGDLRATPGLLAHRVDRGYLDEAGPGYRRAVDPLAGVQLGLDPTVLGRLEERTTATGPAQHLDDSPRGSLAALLSTGHDVWIVDLTTPDVAAAGWHCVRVLATGVARVPVPAFPLDPAGRTSTAARELGWDAPAPEIIPYPGW